MTQLNLTFKNTQRVYIGSFIKVTGEVRTMRFAAWDSQIEKAKTAKTAIKVWDIEEKAFRSFNFAKLVGDIFLA